MMKSKKNSLLALTTILVSVAFFNPATASVLTFDDTNGGWSNDLPNNVGGYNTYKQDGYQLQVLEPGDHTDSTESVYLHNQCCNVNDDIALRLTYVGGNFDLLSLDLNFVNGILNVTNSLGAVIDLTSIDESLGLTINFLNVAWVDFRFIDNNIFQEADLDNFTVQAAQNVPEPFSWLLFSLGLVGLGYRRKRQVG